eukprot:TRINITY_DN102_c0_g4_i1.p1 TRINITY_DN102_c0_g4~~TRINITY_DN102_c0_g4_i1.p1  ORF type:complete len:166 (+),score=5.65 TRINITY_DN102_c0_g4_i1:43-540(+)
MLSKLFNCCTCHLSSKAKPLRMRSTKVEKSDAQWRSELTSQEYKVLRQGATDSPHRGDLNKVLPLTGYFSCKGCGTPLYSAKSKFACGCGWPAFDKCYTEFVATRSDGSGGMARTEILCKICDGHLGHVFNGEGLTATNQRHCVNSSSIAYVNKEIKSQLDEGKV